MSDNSWYEKGELPPVGIECEYFWCGHPEEWRVVTITDSGLDCEIPCVSLRQGNQLRINSNPSCFRPIKTERELAIEAALKVFNVGPETDKLLFTMAGALFDAGLLRSKNES